MVAWQRSSGGYRWHHALRVSGYIATKRQWRLCYVLRELQMVFIVTTRWQEDTKRDGAHMPKQASKRPATDHEDHDHADLQQFAVCWRHWYVFTAFNLTVSREKKYFLFLLVEVKYETNFE